MMDLAVVLPCEQAWLAYICIVMRVSLVPHGEASRNQSAIAGHGACEETCSGLRADPEAIERLELPRRHRPLRDLLIALNGSASIFVTARCALCSDSSAQASHGLCRFASRVDILFARPKMNLDRGQWDLVAQRIEQLLAREGGDDSLYVQLCIGPAGPDVANESACGLGIVLEARGSTPAQAELRWSLGLARIQQALLFISRGLRQESRLA